MRLVFWTFADDCIYDFMASNLTLRALSHDYRFITLCSGERTKALLDERYKTEQIWCENNLLKKGDALLQHLKDDASFDALVKIDMDALVLNRPLLLQTIEEHLRPGLLIGNYRKRNRLLDMPTVPGYIRGGCNVLSASLLKDMPAIHAEGRDRFDFDVYYNYAVQCAGGSLLDKPLFELNPRWTGKTPVWHPPKNDKYRHFSANMSMKHFVI
jgi:hypothetical protein